MIAVEDPSAVLARFWDELRADPDLAGLTALVPTDRALTFIDAIPLAPVAMSYLRTPADQLHVLDRVAHAYLRATGLHVSEE